MGIILGFVGSVLLGFVGCVWFVGVSWVCWGLLEFVGFVDLFFDVNPLY